MLSCFDKNILDISFLTLKNMINFYSNKYKIYNIDKKIAKCSKNKYITSSKFFNHYIIDNYKLYYKPDKIFLKLNNELHPYYAIKQKYVKSFPEFKDYLRNPKKYLINYYINKIKNLCHSINMGFLQHKQTIIITMPKKFKTKKKILIKNRILKIIKKKFNNHTIINKKFFKSIIFIKNQ